MRFFCFFAFLLAIANTPSQAEDITVATYHQVPPFIVDSDAEIGLTYELAQYLTNVSQGRYSFFVEVLPRKRLDGFLRHKTPLVVPWVTPAWFGDQDRERFAWSAPLLQDANAVLSSALRPVSYTGPDSLAGKTISGVLGHRFVGIDPLVEAGTIKRTNVSNFWSAMKMVSVGRVDATIVPASVAKYFIASNNMAGVYHFSLRPHSQYDRHLLIQHNEDVTAFLLDQAELLGQEGVWPAIMARYGM